MIKKTIYSLWILAIAFTGLALKKDKGLEAKITYEITYDELPEMLEAYASMLPKEMVQYVKGSKTRIEQSVMGVSNITVMDSKKKSGFLLMDQFGEKTAYVMDKKDLEGEAEKTETTYTYNYLTETKSIAGYTCKKVEIINTKENTTDIAWVTSEIEGNSTKQYKELKGYALEYSVHGAMEMVLTMKVKSIEKTKISDSYFKIPDGYTKKPMSELKKQSTGG